jgi:hypothetical protein
MYINIYSPTGAFITRLTEHIPNTHWTPDVFEGLSFESVNPGGFTTANFTIHRKITEYWADLAYRNWIVIGNGPDVYWEGYIDKPSRSINPDKIDVGCLGWSATLNQTWYAFDLTAGVGGLKGSFFITDYLVASDFNPICTGTIETSDYAYPEGTRFEFAPATYYTECLEQFNAGNLWDWGVWEGSAINWTAKTPNVVDWVAYARDCKDLVISPNPEALANYVQVHFTQDGSHYEDIIMQDADSAALNGWQAKRVDVPGQIDEDSIGPANPGGATRICTIYLAESKDLKVSASFTLNRVYDIYGVEHHLGEVRAGQNIRLGDYLTTEELLNGVNDITTFQIKSPKYDHDPYSLDITPTEFVPSTETQIARLQAVGY